MQENRLFLLDAFALIYRAYYAMIRNPRMTSYGKNTNAQYGFTNSLLDILNNENPTHIAVCFDSPEETERAVEYSDYKANREAMPEDIAAAIPDIKEIIAAFQIPIVELPGYEADDIIGGLAKQAEKKKHTTYMVTPDKDFGQLVSPNIFIYKPAARGNGPVIMGEKEVCEKWDIAEVRQVIDVLGLMGDASDNIPGIKGVGEKTAIKLLKQYGTLEAVLENADEIKGKLGEKIRAGKQDALISKSLATIITDIPYVYDEKNFERSDTDEEALKEVFEKLEFRSLGKRVMGKDFKIENKSTASAPVFDFEEEDGNPESVKMKSLIDVKVKYELVDSLEGLEACLKRFGESPEIAIDTETTGLDIMADHPVGISLSDQKNEAYYINLNSDEAEERIALLRPWMAKERLWIGHNIKYDQHMLHNIGLHLKGNIYDTMLAHYVLDPAAKHGLNDLSERYLLYKPISIEKLIGPKGKNQKNMRDLAAEKIKNYACEDADITWQLFLYLRKKSEEIEASKKLIEELECPTSSTLLDMEIAGVHLDVEFLKSYSKELEAEIEDTKVKVYECAGHSFNLSSPKQIGEVLFGEMQLVEKPKKTKTGQYKTNEAELLKLQHKHPIVDEILNYRELSKLKSTYVDALPKLISPVDNKLHTTYSQSVAVTGRLSSTNPNLQNIPIKTERGKRIREAFVPFVDSFLLSADYSQIELRIMAYFSKDTTMIAAFRNGEDIHSTTAAKVFGVDVADVTAEMRYQAKAVNFGIIYGQTPFGLSQSLGIPLREAREIIDNYFEEFSSIKDYMEETQENARRNGYVQTLFGRRRYLPDINSANSVVRGFAERNAINSPIQGTAADLIKMAMNHIHAKLQVGFGTKLILQVHDELVLDVPSSEVDEVKNLVHREMTQVYELGDVPLEVSIGIGKNWLEAH